ncbi:MAG: alpha/beta hydrolase [Thermoleophilia bacterium]|nr:alpha/beta hydrolase [Thermoleophilia bacterium]
MPSAMAWTRHPARPGAPADSLPIVLLHGLSGTRYHWEPAVSGLRDLGDVITLDLPGFGASPAPAAWTLDGACDAVIEQLDALGVDRCMLVGHSLGASIGVLLAARAPERVRALGLISPAGFWGRTFESPASKRFELAFAVWRRGVLLGAGNVVKAPPMRVLAFFAMAHRPLASLTRREAELLVAGAAQGRSTVQAREAAIEADLFDVVAGLEQPVELVWGREDRITPFETADRVAAAIPDVQTRFLDDIGHMVMFEARDVVLETVTSLITRRS